MQERLFEIGQTAFVENPLANKDPKWLINP